MSFGRLSGRSRPEPMGEINMTPLIDVMLVLLVIFMVTAPLMTSSLRLDLPTSAAARPTEAPQRLKIGLDAQGRLFLADQRIERADLERRLAEAAASNPLTEVQLRADRAVPYGQVAELIGWVQQSGLSRIGFVAEPGGVSGAGR